MTEQYYFTEPQAAEYLKFSVQFLRKARAQGRGTYLGYPALPHIKVNRSVRYRKSDLDAWAERHLVDPIAR